MASSTATCERGDCFFSGSWRKTAKWADSHDCKGDGNANVRLALVHDPLTCANGDHDGCLQAQLNQVEVKEET